MTRDTLIKIFLYVVIIVILLSVMTFVLFKREFTFSWDDNYERTLLLSEEFSLNDINKLNISLVSTDVTIEKSDSDLIKVEIYGKENRKDRYKVTNDNNILTVKEQAYTNFCIGFCFYNEQIIIYLPTDYNKDIDIKGTSSDINILESYYSDMNIETVSGEIKVQDTKNIFAKTTSGDIYINKSEDAEINSTSGEVYIKSGKNVKVNTTSGDIEVVEALTTEINSTSGEVRIESTGNTNISTMSGDIEITNLNVEIESVINSISGDVMIRKVNDVYIETKTTSGDVNTSNSNRMSENTLKIKTTSGDITIK